MCSIIVHDDDLFNIDRIEMNIMKIVRSKPKQQFKKMINEIGKKRNKRSRFGCSEHSIHSRDL